MTEAKVAAPSRKVALRDFHVPVREGFMLEAGITSPSGGALAPAAAPFATLTKRTDYNRRGMSITIESVFGSSAVSARIYGLTRQ